uniref:Pentatricopeptide repeat-containing protein At2g29760, chloroplastic n=1 Tax=Anthurium amnicola TaxID=1678845 RepID=A0A1D1YDM0_9ARAE
MPTSSDPGTLSLLLQGPLSGHHLPQIHARVFRVGAHQDNLVATRLIGRLQARLAPRVLRHLRDPGIFPFNAAVRVLSESGLSASAFSVFRSLKRRSIPPNGFTFSFLLKACFRSADAGRVHQQVHTHVVKSGLDVDSSVCNGLLLAYAKGVGDVLSAQKLFDGMPEKTNVCSWTCLITGLAQANQPEEALMLFLRLLDAGLRPEDDTLVGVLSACSKVQVIENWVVVFSKLTDIAHNSAHDSIDTVLVYLYSKWGNIEKSRDIFDRVIQRSRGGTSVVTWNAMISGYAQNGHPIHALDLFHQMLASSNPKPNHVTVVSVLSACAEVGDLELGRWAHRYMEVKGCRGVLRTNTILATAIIDMYSKCGSLEEAKCVFHSLAKKDVISFNAMMMGLAVNGQGVDALRLFEEMRRIGVRPNGGSFLGLLCACTHSGLVREGRVLFSEMDRCYSFKPKLEHYTCYVDLLARAGHIEEALEIVTTMPVEPNEQVWGALLCACLVHSRVDAAREAARRLVNVDPQNSAGYVLLSNAYATDSLWGNVTDMRWLMNVRGVRKEPGCSWISVKGVTHEFAVGYTLHPEIQKIYLLLELLFKEMKLTF